MGRAASEGTQALTAGSIASGALAGPPAEALSCVLLTVPAGVVLATVALWAVLHI